MWGEGSNFFASTSTLYTSTDGGLSWTDTGLRSRRVIGRGNRILRVDPPIVHHSTDFGLTWRRARGTPHMGKRAGSDEPELLMLDDGTAIMASLDIWRLAPP